MTLQGEILSVLLKDSAGAGREGAGAGTDRALPASAHHSYSALDLIESHTLTVLPTSEQPLGEYIAHRHELHRDLVDALDRRDRDEALRLIHEHNTSLQSSEDHAAER
ncbi:hypothetical protein AB0E81_31430 [Streptomyces sp. NPDC033538]|uniref:hypothetical protein n=1 Tax=Streptomyces sp. NPDC033538 TaxID=3155367 RepID=UPI0033FA1098